MKLTENIIFNQNLTSLFHETVGELARFTFARILFCARMREVMIENPIPASTVILAKLPLTDSPLLRNQSKSFETILTNPRAHHQQCCVSRIHRPTTSKRYDTKSEKEVL